MERSRLLEIAKDRETCDFCADCGDGDVCVKCEQVKGISFDELREYYAVVQDALRRVDEYDKLEAEGRLVVLPCKVGDIVYYVSDGMQKIIPFEITDYYNTPSRCNFSCKSVSIIKESNFAFKVEAIGKTVFLTRGEAEAALERRKTS